MQIIKYTPKYKQDFIDFNSAWILEYFGALEDADREAFAKIEEEIENGAMIFFAVEDGTALATCMVKPMKDGSGSWEICKLASNQNKPHKGCGSAVFGAAVQWAIDHGAGRLFLISNSKLKPAIRIYEKYGFHEVKLDDYEYMRGDIAFERILRTIRHTEIADLPAVMGVYANARAQMKLTGNPNQWRDSYPPEALVAADIENRNSYVIEQDGEICGVFFFRIGEDPTYRRIEGQWISDAPYGVIHRIAGNGRMKGVFPSCVEFCAEKIANLRVDTHHDNKIMQHQIEKCGFTQCGIIYIEDGSPRIAYQRVGE